MVKTKIIFHLKSDTQIPVRLCSEVAEEFLNRLEKHFEAQLLKGADSHKSSSKQSQTGTHRIDIFRSYEVFGKSAPLYYNDDKGVDNVEKSSHALQ